MQDNQHDSGQPDETPASRAALKPVASKPTRSSWVPRPAAAAGIVLTLLAIGWGAWSVVTRQAVQDNEEDLAEMENFEPIAPMASQPTQTEASVANGANSSLSAGRVPTHSLDPERSTHSSIIGSLGIPQQVPTLQSSSSIATSLKDTGIPQLPNFSFGQNEVTPSSGTVVPQIPQSELAANGSAAEFNSKESGVWFVGTIETDHEMPVVKHPSRVPVRQSFFSESRSFPAR